MSCPKILGACCEISPMKLRILSEGFEALRSSWRENFTIRKIKKFTEVIISEADRLQHLVDKILAPYRQLYHPVPTNVHEILERVRLLVQSEFPEGLKVVRDYDISAPEMMADRGQLTQNFLELNAQRRRSIIRANSTGHGMYHALKTRVVHHVQVGQSFCRTALNIHVIDNGEGIPQRLSRQ